MTKGRISQCDFCFKPNVVIVRGWSTRADKMCIVCEAKRITAIRLEKFKETLVKKEIVPYSPVYAKTTDRQKKKLSEDDRVNEEIWATRPHVCDNCDKRLPATPVKANFSHLLTKGSHPDLRHDPENIVLSCYDCHNLWEFGKNRENMATYQKHIAYMVSKGFVPKDL